MDSFISQIPKRISKLESFIRQNEEKIGSRSLRYYESCVIESKSKGTLFLGHLILTDETLFLTQNPPKSFSHAIQLSQIKNIHLVADRKALVKGPSNNNNYLGQHIELFYSSLKAKDAKGQPNKEIAKKVQDKCIETVESDDDRSSSEEAATLIESFVSLKSCSCFNDHPAIPLAIQHTYHPYSCISLNTPSKQSLEPEKLDKCNAKTQVISQTSYNSKVRNGIVSSSSSSSVKSQIHSEEIRSKSVLEQKLFSWTSREDKLIKNNPQIKRPSSVDISQLSKFHKSTNLKSFLSNALSKNPNKPESKPKAKPKSTELMDEEIGIYIYEPNSLFLNEAFLYWNRKILKSEFGKEISLLGEPERSLHAAEKEFARLGLNQDGELDILMYRKSKPIIWQLNRLFTRLSFLHSSLHRYHHLARLSWKSPILIKGLLGLLKSCILPLKDEEKKNFVQTETQERVLVLQISTYLLVTDIFRFLFESCSTSSTIQPQQEEHQMKISNLMDGKILEWDQITKTLLHSIFSFPNVLNQRKLVPNKVLKVNLNPQAFAKLQWINGRKAKVITLLAMAHNTSAALLYEILSVIHFSRRDLERASILKCLENYHMKLYLRMSVVQVIHLLWPNLEQMTTPECVLLYIHVFALKSLLDNVPTTRVFLQLTFSEEFRYYINSKSADTKIPDRFHLKEKLLVTCDELRKEIIS